MSKPCKTCPFRKDAKPGGLGGGSPETFIAQTMGPWRTPCHAHIDYDDPDWHEKSKGDVPQCVGQAQLRAKEDTEHKNHEPYLATLPDDSTFDSLLDFWMHHTGDDLITTHLLLRKCNIEMLIQEEFARAGTSFVN